ncbi:MAG TPA: hypothetical protein VED17_11195 [Nitrososphaerales archaeon]|nr:hypothetical protein [Nitrososphaerales archaeon]
MQGLRNSTKKLVIVLVAGLATRELLAPFTGHPFDLELWLRIGYYVSRGNDPYTVTTPIPGLSFPGAQDMTWIGYPPTWAFFQAGLYKLYSVSGIDNRFAYYFIVKQPMILADLVVSFLLYRLISELKDVASGVRAFAFWMLCPFTIIISSVWGMFDQIILVIVLGSIFAVKETQKSALMQSLGFLLKVLPLIYLPLLGFVQDSKQKVVSYLAISMGSSIFFALLPYLFFPNWKPSQLAGVGLNVLNKLGGSMNYWIILSVYGAYRKVPASVENPLSILAYAWIPAVLIASGFCAISIRGKDQLMRNLCLSSLFITLVFFLTKSIVNEQYLIYFLGLGLVDYYVLERERRQKLFHAIWVTALIFLTANNTYFSRFLEPLSLYWKNLDTMFANGPYGEIRFGIMLVSGLLFTVFAFVYLVSLYHEIEQIREAPRVPLNNR